MAGGDGVSPHAQRLGRFDARALDVDALLGAVALAALAAVPVLHSKAALVFLAAGLLLAAFRPARTVTDLLTTSWLMLLPVFCLISTIWSLYPGATLRHAVQLSATIVIGILIARRIRLDLAVRSIHLTLLPLVLASVAFGAYRSDTGALVGFFGSKNEMAAMAAILALMGLGMATHSNLRWPARMIGAMGFGIGLLAVLRAQSIGALIYLPAGVLALVGIGLIARLGASSRLLTALFAGLIVAIAGLAVAAHFALASAVFLDLTGKDLTLTGRLDLWRVALNLIAERPLLGTGYQAFWVEGHAPAEALWAVFGIESRSGFNFHNTYLSNAVEIGLVGVALEAIMIGTALVLSARLACRSRSRWAGLLFAMAAMLGAMTLFEVPVFFQFNLQSVLFVVTIVHSRDALRRIRSGVSRQSAAAFA